MKNRYLLPALAATAVAALPTTAQAADCSVTKDSRNLGPSYVTSLTVTKTTCTTGKRVVRDYYRCRIAAGGVKGRCEKKVRGYTCSEKRKGIKIQFDAKVTCKKGKARVVHTYIQNT